MFGRVAGLLEGGCIYVCQSSVLACLAGTENYGLCTKLSPIGGKLSTARKLAVDGMFIFVHPKTRVKKENRDQTFHNYGASKSLKSLKKLTLFSSEPSINEYRGSKIAK